MKKYESIYKIINYVYKKDSFTLRDLMTEFHISKSTALRYITALEDIGVPLYSEMGRYGGYKILETYQIPPISFTPPETYALFFLIKSMELMESMPFQAEYSTIQDKFLNLVAPKIKASLEQINSRISFGTMKIINECPMLENILEAIMNPSVLRIVYQTSGKETIRRIQPLGIFAEYGNWYSPAFDMDKKEYRLFRCDRIHKLDRLEDQPLDIQEFDLKNRFQLVRKSPDAIDYKIEITKEGKSIFERSHYPNMLLNDKNEQIFITGWIEPSEGEFLTNYIHQFGQFLVDIEPPAIKANYIKQLESIMHIMNGSSKP